MSYAHDIARKGRGFADLDWTVTHVGDVTA